MFHGGMNRVVLVKNLAELRGYGGCHYSWDRETGTLKIFQKTFADEFVREIF